MKILHEVTLEKMSLSDLKEVLAIEMASFPSPWNEGFFLQEIKCPTSYFFVMKHHGSVIGYAGYWKVLDEAHVANIALHPSYRGKGLGRLLFRYLLTKAHQGGAMKASLEVRKANTIAQNLYQSFDFKSVAIRRNYYSEEGEDALVMWNDDIGATLKAQRKGQGDEDFL